MTELLRAGDSLPKAGAILVDFPWKGQGGEPFYRTLPTRRFLDLPLAAMALPSAHLYVWVPNGLIATATNLVTLMGWDVRGVISWIKNKPGRPTRYLQANTELLIFATRGDAPALVRGQQTALFAPVGLHSEKPAESHAIVERLSPEPYVELFARTRPSSSRQWFVHGDELWADFVIDGFPVPSDFVAEADR